MTRPFLSILMKKECQKYRENKKIKKIDQYNNHWKDQKR